MNEDTGINNIASVAGKINDVLEPFFKDNAAAFYHGKINKAAARRARVASNKLSKLLKDYRAVSNETEAGNV